MGEVRNALREVFKHGANTLRICLLIDGLDENQEGRCEHQRGHQALVRYLQSLAYGATYPSCHIKMILASRAEGIFREGFKERPGFAIHDYTKDAIYRYACRHVQSNNCDPLLELCGVLIEKAQGVIIWVKLVVEELIEGYIAGDTISQLRNTINSLPKKITELYQRVLERRSPVYLPETYVMLQLVLRALAPLTLAQLMAATDASTYNGGDAMSTESMERRLASRCGGLLEVADGSQFSASKAGNVQFSHQTVKSYVERPETVRHIFRQGQEIPSEKASLLMLRYCLSMVRRPMDPNVIDQLQSKSGNLRYLFRYAAIEESCMSSGSASILTMLLRKARYCPALLAGNNAEMGTDKTEDPLARRRDGLYVWASHCLRRDCPIRYECLQSHERKHVLLMLAAAHGLCNFVNANIEAHSMVDVPARCFILYGAVCSTVVDTWGYGTNSQTVEMTTYLLDHGANPDAAYNNRTPLGYLLQWCTLPKAYDSSENTWKTILCVVELLLCRGANANALVGGGLESSLACLAIASKRHSVRLLQSLVNHRADLSAQDAKGLRTLYPAVYYTNQEAVYVLLEAGANPCDMGNSIDALDRSTFAKEDLTLNRNMKKMQDLFQSWTPGKMDEILDRADNWESRNFFNETFSDMAI